MKKEYKLLTLILVVGLLLRSYPVLTNTQTNSDGVLYAWIGGNLADGYGYTIAEGTTLSDARAWHVPAFPAVLAIFYKIIGKGLLISKLQALIFSVLSIGLMYLIGRRLFDETTGLIAALFLAIHPQIIYSSSEVMAESMYIFFLLLFLYSLIFQIGSGDFRLHILTGIIAGICYLTRSAGILIIPVFFVYHFFKNRKIIIGKGRAFFGGFFLIALPWWVWSRINYGTPFSAEQNTLIQMYQHEFGFYGGNSLNIFSYLFEFHGFSSLVTGYGKGVLIIIRGTFLPIVPYPGDEGGIGVLTLLALALVGYVLVFGIWTLIKNERIELTSLFLAFLITGILGHAWGVHILSPQGSTLLRYTLPLIPILILYLAFGIKVLFEKTRVSRVVSIACVFVVVLSSLSITYSTNRVYRSGIDSFYMNALIDLPRDAPVLASNPSMLRRFGFEEVYPLGRMYFDDILHESDEKNIRFIVVDTSSLYNDDQFYLVNHWYVRRIPKRIIKISEDLFPVTTYRVSR